MVDVERDIHLLYCHLAWHHVKISSKIIILYLVRLKGIDAWSNRLAIFNISKHTIQLWQSVSYCVVLRVWAVQ